jgi:aryl-alcohol dehydrogenase-like predicted oxidoreductase
MQNQHNAIYREEEREMMPMLKYYGVGTIPWGPIAAGRESSTPLYKSMANASTL